MKKLREILQAIIYPTCTIATLLTLVFLAFAFSSQNAFAQPGITPQGFGLILLWSFLFVCTCQIFRMKLALGFRVLIHYLVCTATFIICFIFLGGYYANNGATSLYVVFAFTVVYFLIAIPLLLLRNTLKKKKNESKKYRSMLQKSKHED